jgi:hypothetical protein
MMAIAPRVPPAASMIRSASPNQAGKHLWTLISHEVRVFLPTTTASPKVIPREQPHLITIITGTWLLNLPAESSESCVTVQHRIHISHLLA